MLEASKKQVPLKSYFLERRIDSVNQILKNKETRNISILTRITDPKIQCVYIHLYQILKNWRPGPYNSLRHADNRKDFLGLSLTRNGREAHGQVENAKTLEISEFFSDIFKFEFSIFTQGQIENSEIRKLGIIRFPKFLSFWFATFSFSFTIFFLFYKCFFNIIIWHLQLQFYTLLYEYNSTISLMKYNFLCSG